MQVYLTITGPIFLKMVRGRLQPLSLPEQSMGQVGLHGMGIGRRLAVF